MATNSNMRTLPKSHWKMGWKSILTEKKWHLVEKKSMQVEKQKMSSRRPLQLLPISVSSVIGNIILFQWTHGSGQIKHTRQLITPVIFSSVLLLWPITRLIFCRVKWGSSVWRMTMERWRSRNSLHIEYFPEILLYRMNWLTMLIQQKMVKHCSGWKAGMQMAMVKLTIGRRVYSPQKRTWRWQQFTKKNRLPSRQKSNCHCSLNRNFQLPQSLI